MIKLDAGGEEFVFENDWDTAVPITVRKKHTGELMIEVFPTYEPEAWEFAERYGDDPFTPEALSFIWKRIGEPMRARGYEDEVKFRHRWSPTYVLRRCEEINKSVILPETVRLTREIAHNNINRTTFDLDCQLDDEMICFVTVIGGEIVSIASENTSCSRDFDDDPDCEGVTEIGVETAVGHRGRGYASSCAAALADALITETGGYVTYETNCDNIGSQKTALRAGFREYGRCYYYVMRKII